MKNKRYIKIAILTVFICFFLAVILFLLAWSGKLGPKYHSHANNLISMTLYPDHYYGREEEFELVSHKSGCIGNCELDEGIVEKFGMLSIRQPTDGCFGGSCNKETKYRLKESVLKNGQYKYSSIVLKRPKMPDKYDELMVKIYGAIEKDAIEDFNTYDLMTVEGYEILSKVTYHRFLREEKGRYTKEKYGCKVGWNATFGWEYTNEKPIIKARMFSNPKGPHPEKFVELWYDGNTAEFIKEENNLGLLLDPCDIPN